MIAFQPVRVETGSDDEEGMLVFLDDRLLAILVRLSSQHDSMSRSGFLEHGFGLLDGPQHPSFEDVAEVEDWIHRRLEQRGGGGARVEPRT